MPLPLAPIAGLALRYGTVALASYALARRTLRSVEAGRRDQRAEDALDDTPEGATLRREAESLHGTGRWKRVFRMGEHGYEVDATALGRVRFRRV